MPSNPGRLPRFPLGAFPTPLHDATRLRAALGGSGRCPRILIKRDDLSGLAFGGNKVRKLEYLVADALAHGATTLITAGAAQSNHARATAAAAVMAGLRAILVLDTNDPDQQPQGNLLLDHLLGAEVRLVPSGTDSMTAMLAVAEEIRGGGEVPYVIPVGGSNAIGATGYSGMIDELAVQLFELNATCDALYFANGSRGTQAGIVLGARVHGLRCDVRGVIVSANTPERTQRTVDLANGAAELLGSDVRIAASGLTNIDGYVGGGYAVPTAAADEAILLLARTEAVFLDPVYTGKAMSALIDHVTTGIVTPEQTVVFVHTGGSPALFAHADRLMQIAQDG